MIFRGISIRFSTENDGQFETIGAFLNRMRLLLPGKALQGLGFNFTKNRIEYVIGSIKDSGIDFEDIEKQMKTDYPDVQYKEICIPDAGWEKHFCRIEDLGLLYKKIYQQGPLTYEIETIHEDGECVIEINRSLPALVAITPEQIDEVMQLYNDARTSEGCVWDAYYPNREVITQDILQQDLFGILDEKGQVIAAIAKDRDPEVDALPCWSKDKQPAAELARLVVSKRFQNQGMARILITRIKEVLLQRGFQSVHYMVAKDNVPAQRSYETLGFAFCGETDMFGHHFLCYEQALE